MIDYILEKQLSTEEFKRLFHNILSADNIHYKKYTIVF